eukprot:Em0009g608a
MSKGCVFDNKKPIMGGIPVVFPKFGSWDMGRPFHGFARINHWQFNEPAVKDHNGNITGTFTFTDTEETRTMWDNNRFKVILTVTLTAESLFTGLSVLNLNDTTSFDFTILLHTYIYLPDVTKITISGLNSVIYRDHTDDRKEKLETADKKSIHGHIDNVYVAAKNDHVITNVAGNKTLCLKKTNLPDTVIWNPWTNAKIYDFADNEQSNMICIEAGYVVNPYTLLPGKEFVCAQHLLIA